MRDSTFLWNKKTLNTELKNNIMKHLLTILLLSLTTSIYSQETELLGKSLETIIEIQGGCDDYGIEDGQLYIEYQEYNPDYRSIYFFDDNDQCDGIFMVTERPLEYGTRQVLNEDFTKLDTDKWIDVENDAYIRLMKIYGKLIMVISKE